MKTNPSFVPGWSSRHHLTQALFCCFCRTWLPYLPESNCYHYIFSYLVVWLISCPSGEQAHLVAVISRSKLSWSKKVLSFVWPESSVHHLLPPPLFKFWYFVGGGNSSLCFDVHGWPLNISRCFNQNGEQIMCHECMRKRNNCTTPPPNLFSGLVLFITIWKPLEPLLEWFPFG